jgi:hypothetical protein
MPYMSINKQSKITFMHSFHFNYAPSAFNGTWTTNANRGGAHELRNAEDYYIPLANTIHMARFPMFSLPREWTWRALPNIIEIRRPLKLNLKKIF